MRSAEGAGKRHRLRDSFRARLTDDRTRSHPASGARISSTPRTTRQFLYTAARRPHQLPEQAILAPGFGISAPTHKIERRRISTPRIAWIAKERIVRSVRRSLSRASLVRWGARGRGRVLGLIARVGARLSTNAASAWSSLSADGERARSKPSPRLHIDISRLFSPTPFDAGQNSISIPA
jgi:hypothetical protein